MSNPETNQAIFDRDAEVYTELALMPPERAVMGLMRGRLHDLEMLDIGVGAGRTAYTFASLVHRYVGVDYSPRMIELARNLVGEEDRVELMVGDARNLSAAGGPFDFVLFSFNGIDAVGHEDRQKILSEVREVLKPDGHFLFSAHSIGALPLTPRRPRGRYKSGSAIREAYRFFGDLRYAWDVHRSNRVLDLAAARKRGWTTVRDVAHGFSLEVYYVDPAEQLEQLRRAGLDVLAVFDPAGREVDPLEARRDPWLSYLCHPMTAGS